MHLIALIYQNLNATLHVPLRLIIFHDILIQSLCLQQLFVFRIRPSLEQNYWQGKQRKDLVFLFLAANGCFANVSRMQCYEPFTSPFYKVYEESPLSKFIINRKRSQVELTCWCFHFTS